MSSERERHEARILLAEHLGRGISAAMAASPQPQLVLSAVPMTLAGMAGSYALQFMRARTIGDGQIDQLLDLMATTMREHADPSLNPPTGDEPPPSVLSRIKGWFQP